MNRLRLHAVVTRAEAAQRPYPYVHVNADGSVRELHESERRYLEETFHPADGGRPYVKHSFGSRDGWGSLEGFCRRDRVPDEASIVPAPAEGPNPPMSKEQLVDRLRTAFPGGNYGFRALSLKRIVATTTYDNEASIAVMRRIGMEVHHNPHPEPPWMQIVAVIQHGMAPPGV